MTQQNFRRYRFRAACPIEILSDNGRALSHARNVNQFGMRLDNVVPADCGDEMTIAIDAYQAKAVVKWKTQDAIGVAFDRQISPAFVDHMRFTRDTAPKAYAGPPANQWAF